MKHLVTSSLIVFALLIAGCSSSKKSASIPEVTVPVVGAWTMQDGNGGALQFMSNGEFTLEQGDILAAINRFQNTDRARYISRLIKNGTYEFNGPDKITLNVMADWTGKGTGSRRAEDKSVASMIVFAVEDLGGDTVTLRKVSMTQNGSGTDNMNSDEALSFSLMRIK